MELRWIGLAFLVGLLARFVRQPPLVGFLVAGFLLELLGFRSDAAISELADVGVKLLLFSLGLKLDLNTFKRVPLVLGGLGHMLTMTAIGAVWAHWTLPELATPMQRWIIAFAMGFSSTIFSVRVLDERSDTADLYGRFALAILILQDVAAVVFMAASTGKLPSPYALLLPGLWFLRPYLRRLLRHAGHGELLVLAGLSATLGGAALFELVGLKGDVGAIFAGLLLRGEKKGDELARSLLSLKELFLVGFFLQVGLTGLPTWETVRQAAWLMALLPVKIILFTGVFLLMGMRVRSVVFGTLNLGTFSEFGLIVVALAVQLGWLDESWAIVVALAIAGSFLIMAPLNALAQEIYQRVRPTLRRFLRDTLLPEEADTPLTQPKIVVFGLGGVGEAALEHLHAKRPGAVLGFDIDQGRIDAARAPAALGSATDPALWERCALAPDKLELVLLSLANQQEHMAAVHQLRRVGVRGKVVSLTNFDDEARALKEAGADAAYAYSEEAGRGFAEHALSLS